MEFDTSCVNGGESGSGLRAEIDTSAPFESVKEAVNRFGGVGYWKPSNAGCNKHKENEHGLEEVDIVKLEEQALQLEKDNTLKERETLDVLIELEQTKKIIDELKKRLLKEGSNFDLDTNVGNNDMSPLVNEAEKENRGINGSQYSPRKNMIPCPSAAPGLILMELKQAKVNLTRTTSDLADIRDSVETFKKKLEIERMALEKTRVRLTSSSLKTPSLEEEFNQTKQKLHSAKDADSKGAPGPGNSLDISMELQRLSCETERFKKMAEAAKLEVLKTTSEIEQTRSKLKTAEIRLVAARKMKSAARAAEAYALAEIEALSNQEDASQKPEVVTLSYEEYSTLTRKVQDAEELAKKRERDAMKHVHDANLSKTEILKRVEEETEELKTSRMALEEALNRIDIANTGKLRAEEALCKWRSHYGQNRRSSLHNSTKFKNPCPSSHARELQPCDVNSLKIASEESMPVLRPTLSIGQILSRKLMLPEDDDEMELTENIPLNQVSLGQMLSKRNDNEACSYKCEKASCLKNISAKRKKSGLARFSLLLTKQSRNKKKKPAPDLR